MNFRPFRTAVLAAVASAVLAPATAHSQVASIDFAQLAQQLQSNTMALLQWAEEKQLLQIARLQDIEIAGMSLQNKQDATANSIIRQNQRRTDLHNHTADARATPANDACENVAVSVSMDDAICGREVEKSDSLGGMRAKHHVRDETPGEYVARTREIAEGFLEDCEQYGCASVDSLFGGESGLAIVERDGTLQSSRLVVDLISGPLPARRTDPRMGNTMEAMESRIADERREAFRDLVRKSLMEVRAVRVSAGPPSELAHLWSYATNRWGGPEAETWLKEITNTHPDKGTLGSEHRDGPEEVLRKMAQMQAFQLYMDVERHRQQLRMEALMAASLALDVEPLR